jgi:hypothetical protein
MRASFVGALVVAALCVLWAAGGGSAARTAACGLPDTSPVWIDYGEGSVRPDTRAVLARPGVVVASSGTAIPAQFRAAGAATTYFVLKLPVLVGDPSKPADPATIDAAADALLAKAQTSTGCATPWIALNELLGSGAVTPWTPTTAQYRADVLELVRRLAAGGAHPALLVHGDPYFGDTAADWWRQVGSSSDIVYEAYYDATNITRLGPLVGNRRMRLGMRSFVSTVTALGVPPARVGFMLGFHSAQTPGIGGRQGLQPREAWLRVVKWEALAARQVAADTGAGSIWSWGWGTFGPDSVDPDKAAAACVWLWARDSSLCDGPGTGGPAFVSSLVEGQIVLPAGVYCGFAGGRHVATAEVEALLKLTGDRHVAVTAAFEQAALRGAATVPEAQVLAVERRVIARTFHGSRHAYLAALSFRHATLGVARALIRDELRRRAIARRVAGTEAPLAWMEDKESALAATATCVRDDLPGYGDFPVSDTLDVGVVPLLSSLRFLFADRTPPAPVVVTVGAAAAGAVTLSWADGREPDLAGYAVYRAATPLGPFKRVNTLLLARPTFIDRSLAAGATAYYVVRAVDSSGNLSGPSPQLSAQPAPPA